MKIRYLTILSLTAVIAACSSTPDRNNSLEQARNNFNAAQNNPEITTLAANELKQASDALVQAEIAWKKKDKDLDVDHLAYLANQRVTIARETAANRAAQAIVDNAEKERNELRLGLRTNEVDAARRQALQSEESAQLARDRAAELERELDAKKTERGMVVTLGDVLFETAKSELQPNATRNISRLAEFLQAHPETDIQIEGHTDSVGSSSYNYGLAQRRADSVKAALMSAGIAADRIVTRSHGPDMPTASNDNAAGRQMNRRVEIIFPNP
jgi:outer membrane protein OmpA-like peptidoglycan-associated protein